MNLLPADTYIVVNKTILHNSDRNILVMLYQPILGSDAISLYFTLWSYLDRLEVMSVECTHHHLMASLNLDLDKIYIARTKLEGIGLIKTYLKEVNGIKNYVYELYSPMSAYEFLTNPVLATSLSNNIGLSAYEKIVKFYKKANIDLNSYKDITKTFSETFSQISDVNYDIIVDDIKKSSKRALDIVSKINLNDLFALIPEEILKHNISKVVKDLIHKLSFIYNFNNEDMLEIIKSSINDKKEIDNELLKESAKKYYRFETKGKLATIVYKEEPAHLRSNISSTSNKAKLIYQFETTSPYDFLSSKQNYSKPTKYDVAILEYLLIELSMNPGVVNVLIDYVLKINNNKLTKGYIEVIASQWKRNNILKVEEAMDFAANEYNSKSKRKVKKEVKPVWFDKEEVMEVTDQDKEEFSKMLENYK